MKFTLRNTDPKKVESLGREARKRIVVGHVVTTRGGKTVRRPLTLADLERARRRKP